MDRFTANHLQGVSRTYAILVPMLPGPLAEAVGVAYLLMRVVDTLEDAPGLSNDERRARFARLEAALRGDEQAAQALTEPIGETDDENALLRDVPELMARVQAMPTEYREPMRECARAMSDGVLKLLARSEQRGLPYPAVRNAAELREYCYYVAGVVGEMLCAMMAHYLDFPGLLRLRELAVELGIGLQLVNILKDALKDSKQGRRYLPMAVDGGVSHREIYRAALGEARRCLGRGVDYVLALPAGARELRGFCGLPIAWGAMTLSRAERNDHEAKINRGAIQGSIELFGRVAGDDQKLAEWLRGLLRRTEENSAATA
jgi:farnesyl-diphosphate farnesyltransferase